MGLKKKDIIDAIIRGLVIGVTVVVYNHLHP